VSLLASLSLHHTTLSSQSPPYVIIFTHPIYTVTPSLSHVVTRSCQPCVISFPSLVLCFFFLSFPFLFTLTNLYPTIRAEVCMTTLFLLVSKKSYPALVYPNSVTLFGFISRWFTKTSKNHVVSYPFSAVTRNANSSPVRHLVVHHSGADLGRVSPRGRSLGGIHCPR